MKSYEDFRAAVYDRAEREQARITARRKKLRNASLSAVTVLIVAALAVPMVRNASTSFGPAATDRVEEVQNSINQAGSSSRMVLLVKSPSGETQAVILENNDKQKEFYSKYKAAMNLAEGEDLPMMPEADTKTIHSTDELSQFLSELPKAAESAVTDFDEAFFEANDLCAMPMSLDSQTGTTAPEGTTNTLISTVPQPTTIPDGAPDETTGETTTSPDESTSLAQPTQSLPAEALQGGVKVLLLVPVPNNK